MLQKPLLRWRVNWYPLSEDINKARELGYIPVVAWNISMYPHDQIFKKIELVAQEKTELVAQEYEKNNPGVIQAELISQGPQRLVDIKLKKCSGIN